MQLSYSRELVTKTALNLISRWARNVLKKSKYSEQQIAALKITFENLVITEIKIVERKSPTMVGQQKILFNIQAPG